MKGKARARQQRAGSVDPFKRPDGSVYYRGRIRLGDGTLHRLTIEEPFCSVEADARKYTATMQAEEDAHGRILAAKRGGPPVAVPIETVRDWHKRWVASRIAKGNTSTRDDKSRYETHVDALIGNKQMAVVTRSDVEDIVEALDGKVRTGDLSWHTAWNVWAVVSKMFRDASTAKQRDLRVREDNPCDRVAPPDRGVRLAKQFLYPSELQALLACEAVALEWRRLVAVAVYLFPRAGELEALEWEDIDLDRGIIHIHRGIDRERGESKGDEDRNGAPLRHRTAILPFSARCTERERGALGRRVHAPDARPCRGPAQLPPVGKVTDANCTTASDPQGADLARPARDGDHVDGDPRRRSPPHPAPRRSHDLLHYAGLHPPSRGDSRRLRRRLPAGRRAARRH